MTITDIEVRRLTGAIGAEVTGFGPDDVDDALFTRLEALLAEHLVLFLPGWSPTLEQHCAFAARFGPVEVHPVLGGRVDPDRPEIVLIDGLVRADKWHTDVTWAEHPPIASIFHYVSGPAHGGDTMWTNMEQAFAELSAPMQEFVSGLTATHSGALFGLPERTAVHPVVRVHPTTGRPSVYVNRTFTSHINEVSPAESRSLLDLLYRHSEQPHLSMRHTWSVGDVCIWDNRSTMHNAVNDYGEDERIAHRVTVLGDTPRPAGELRHEAFAPAGFSSRTILDSLDRLARPASAD